MKSWKKFLIVSLSFLFVVTSIFAGLSNFGNASNNTNKNQSQNQESGVVTPEAPNGETGTNGNINMNNVYFASDSEETGASAAPRERKGGAFYVGDDSTLLVEGKISNHESNFGGAIYVANGGKVIISGAIIEYNYAELGGAIYVESGGVCEIQSGTIVNNKAENAAIYVEAGGTCTFGETAVVDQNDYINYQDTIIDFYVNGIYLKTVTQRVPTLMETTMPFSYENCNGYFLDEGLTQSVEFGDDMSLMDNTTSVPYSAVSSSGVLNVSLYTKKATPDTLEFHNLDDIAYSVSIIAVADTHVIPKQYNGKNIVSFHDEAGTGAFKSSTTIKSIYMPSTIMNIPDYTFQGSTIENINFHSRLKTIGSQAFYTSNLKNAIIADSDYELSIGTYAFADCASLENVRISNNAVLALNTSGDVYDVGNSTLRYTPSLKSITVSSDSTRYSQGYDDYGNTYLIYKNNNEIIRAALANEQTTMVVPTNVTRIGRYAFNQLPLEEIVLHDAIVSIGKAAFRLCESLSIANFNGLAESELEFIDANAFDSCTFVDLDFTTLTNLEQVGETVFKNCTSLKTIFFADNANITFSGYAFQNNTSLEKVVLPKTLTQISNGLFAGCSSLKYVELIDGKPCNIVNIGGWAFNNCTSLIYIKLPYVKTIGFRSFYNCSNLERIYLSDNTLKTIDDYAFHNCKNLKYTNDNQSFDLPYTLTTIGYASFYNCTAIKNLSILNNKFSLSQLETIDSAAFVNCSSLERVFIPQSLKTSGSSSFEGCSLINLVTTTNPNVFAKINFGNANSNPLKYAKLKDGAPEFNLGIISDNGELNFEYNITALEGLNPFSYINLRFNGTLNVSGDIGKYALQNAKILDLNISSINYGELAFSGIQITNIEFGMEIVPASTFNISSIESIYFAKNVKSISTNAFTNCTNLIDVKFYSENWKITNNQYDSQYYVFESCVSEESAINLLIEGNNLVSHDDFNFSLVTIDKKIGTSVSNYRTISTMGYKISGGTTTRDAIYLHDLMLNILYIPSSVHVSGYDYSIISVGSFRDCGIDDISLTLYIPDSVCEVSLNSFANIDYDLPHYFSTGIPCCEQSHDLGYSYNIEDITTCLCYYLDGSYYKMGMADLVNGCIFFIKP